MPVRLPALLAALLLSVTSALADYRGALVMDAATGAILHEENADAVSPPASVAKLMTFLVVHDALAAGRVRLDTPITATPADQSMGGTQVNLAAGETFPVEELLYALMVESANDAAHALTQILGDRATFVAAMNARAQALGMRNTRFTSPHGLPPSSRKIEDGDLTSPRDLALLARELVSRTDVARYSSVRVRPFGTGFRAEPLPMRNHNKLLTSVDGCDGLKTGFTRSAGFCLVATAQRGPKRVIVAVMGSPDAKTRDAHVKRLIEDGFAKIPATSVFQGPPTALTPVAAPASPVATPDAPPAVQFKLPGKK
jgi:D-alanyl-D-alanine carboxypeptidase (penicillin-binding protein 5/6)